MQPTYEELFAQNQVLIKQLNEALLEFRQLKEENWLVKEENWLLKEENRLLGEENQQLKTGIRELRAEVLDLKDKLNTNSSNSSQSPSQDPFRKRGKSNKASGRKQGAQKGHRGHSRDLIPPEQVQTVHNLKPNACPDCQSNVSVFQTSNHFVILPRP